MKQHTDVWLKGHPKKTNTLISVIIILLILNISVQIWLLYVGLNNALGKNNDIAVPAFLASLFLFIVGQLCVAFCL